MTTTTQGDPQALPATRSADWSALSAAVWHDVEAEALARWPFKCRDAIARAPGPHDDHRRSGWLSVARGRLAEAMGVPIGKLFTAARLRQRREYVQEG